jgi:hypothetical protein
MISMIAIATINNNTTAIAQQTKNFEREKNAIMLLDALVKNSSQENPALGAAKFDATKHRVIENNIDVEKIKQANPIISEKISIRKISLRYEDGSQEKILENSLGTNCLGIERLVLANNKKALLKGVVCIE